MHPLITWDAVKSGKVIRPAIPSSSFPSTHLSLSQKYILNSVQREVYACHLTTRQDSNSTTSTYMNTSGPSNNARKLVSCTILLFQYRNHFSLFPACSSPEKIVHLCELKLRTEVVAYEAKRPLYFFFSHRNSLGMFSTTAASAVTCYVAFQLSPCCHILALCNLE